MTTHYFEGGFPTETLKEGKVQAVVPKLKAYVTEPSDYAPSKAPVFYNPVMELNRDVSVLALQAYQRTVNREISICEPLTSSGIRGIRFATEVNGVSSVSINDISERAVNLAKHNIELNRSQERVTVTHMDANCLLSCNGAPNKRFDVVDVDPFGSPVPYLDSAVRALRDDGLLAVTATDLAPLCGVHPKACIRRYGGKPLRTEYCHELAVRLLIGCIAATAAKQDIGIRVLFSHSTDHYVRAYVQIDFGAKKADETIKNLGYVLHCFSCLHRETATTLFTKKTQCPECGSNMEYAGPLWLGKIVDKQFRDLMAEENAKRAFRNHVRIATMLTQLEGEAEAPPTYYVIDKISNKLAVPVPSVSAMLGILREQGHEAVPAHFHPLSIKTDVPAIEMQRLLRLLVDTQTH